MIRLFPGLMFVFLLLSASVCIGYDFNEQFLAATCVPDTNFVKPKTVNNTNGIAVGFPTNKTGTIVLYCQIDADESNYFNAIQIIAEDNSSNADATATLFQQDIINPAPPVAIGSITTTDQSGVQVAMNAGLDLSLNEYQYVYWIKIVINRTSTSASILVYNVSLMDVL